MLLAVTNPEHGDEGKAHDSLLKAHKVGELTRPGLLGRAQKMWQKQLLPALMPSAC